MGKLTEWKEKYEQIPMPVKASFWFMVMSVIQNGIQFLVTPIYTRILTTEEYGYYAIYGSWSSFLVVLATLNLSAGGFNNGMLKYENDRKRFMSSMQGLGNIVTLLVFSVIFIFCDTFSGWMRLEPIVLIGLFIQLLFAPAFSLWSQHQRYLFKYKALSVATLIVAVATPTVSLLLIYLLPERKYAVVFGSLVVQIAIGIVFYVANLIQGKSLCKKEYWDFALKFNLPLIPHYLSNIILGQADRIMISHYCGEDKAGIYSLSYTVSIALTIFVNAIASTYAPWTYQQLKVKDYRKIKIFSNYILVAIGIIGLCGILVAPEIILILGTKEYLEAKWIIAPVMLGCYFTMVYSLFANVEFYYEKSTSVMLASVVAAVSNIVLNAVFIPKFGFIAAGYTTLICYVLLAIMHYLSMRWICKENNIGRIYDLKFIVLFSVALTVVSLLLMITYNMVYIRYGMIVGGIVSIVLFRKKIVKTIFDKIKCYKQ